MERLTEKVNDYWITNDKAHIYYLDTNESVFVGNVIDRLAELEDVIEEYGIENLEDFIIKHKDQNIDYDSDYARLMEKYDQLEGWHEVLLEDNLKYENQIEDLQHQLAITEKALELCERHHIGFEELTVKEQVDWKETRIKENTNYFKQQAEKEIKGEKGE